MPARSSRSRQYHSSSGLSVFVALAIVLATQSSCGRIAGGVGGRADTLYVGVAVGLTSPARYVNVFEGVQMALDELNASRAPGSPALGMRRAPSTAKTDVDIAAAFRDDPQVIGVVGHTESAATITAAAVYADRTNGGKRALVAVSPTAGSPAVTAASEWVFRVCPTTTDQARTLARYLADSLGIKRTGFLYKNDASGIDLLKAFTDEYSRRSGSISERDPFTEDITEFEAYSHRLVQTGAPGAVIAGNTTEERPFARSFRAAGGRAVLVGTNPPEAGDSASALDLKGMRFLQLFSALHPPTQEGTRFVAAFRTRTGRTADRWAALGYDAAMLIGQATHAEGADRRRIRDWIAGVGGAHAAYAGATGMIAFDAHRNPIDKHMSVGEANQ